MMMIRMIMIMVANTYASSATQGILYSVLHQGSLQSHSVGEM